MGPIQLRRKTRPKKIFSFFQPALGVPGEEVGVAGGAGAGTHRPGGYLRNQGQGGDH